MLGGTEAGEKLSRQAVMQVGIHSGRREMRKPARTLSRQAGRLCGREVSSPAAD